MQRIINPCRAIRQSTSRIVVIIALPARHQPVAHTMMTSFSVVDINRVPDQSSSFPRSNFIEQ